MEGEISGFAKYLVAIGFIILAVVLWFSLTGPECGDGVCASREECCADCGCADNQECNQATQQCEGFCGDGVCAAAESCCDDCGCPDNTVCDKRTHSCRPVTSVLCGNEVCDVGENAEDCCIDCGCEQGYACNLKSYSCVRRGNRNVCGDGVCDFGEYVYNCCQDCPFCESGTACDEVTSKCVPEKISVETEHAVSLFKIFLRDEGLTSEWVDAQRFQVEPAVFEGRPVLRVCNVLPHDSMSVADLVCARVTEQGRVVGYERFW